jgi:hypothetical protein
MVDGPLWQAGFGDVTLEVAATAAEVPWGIFYIYTDDLRARASELPRDLEAHAATGAGNER